MSERPSRQQPTSLSARARELGVDRGTLKRWMDKGIGPVGLDVGGTIIIPPQSWEEWKRKHSTALS